MDAKKRIEFRRLSFSIIFSFLISLSFLSCEKKLPPQAWFLMNTVCSVNLYDQGTEVLYSEINRELVRLENIFSVTLPESEISKINFFAGVKAVEVSEDVVTVLKAALEIADMTDGAFNPAANPLIELWGINTDHAKVPEESEIKSVMKLLDWKDISISEADGKWAVFLGKKGMSLNFGGIVKGYATDRIVSILDSHKIRKAIIDLGGNIYVYGKKDDGSLWTVGIKDPLNPTGNPKIKFKTESTSVVTSGIYERFFESNGIIYHHIFDTKTGYPVDNNLASSSVISKSSLAADLLSTTIFVLGEKKALSLQAAFEKALNCDLQFIFIDKNGNIK